MHPKNHNYFSVYIDRISATCMRMDARDNEVMRKKEHWALGTDAGTLSRYGLGV